MPAFTSWAETSPISILHAGSTPFQIGVAPPRQGSPHPPPVAAWEPVTGEVLDLPRIPTSSGWYSGQCIKDIKAILKQSAAETWRNQWNQPLSNQFRSSLGTSFSMNSQAGLHCQARHNEWIKAPRKLSMEAPGWKDSSSNLGSAKLGKKWSKKT